RKYNRRMGLYYDYDKSNFNRFTYFLYSRVNKKGVIKTEKKGKVVNLKVICFDAAGNKSTMRAIFKSGKEFSKPKY
ncbi:hypothetical protein ACFL20_11880, partial [Spirochaetota bacterium]